MFAVGQIESGPSLASRFFLPGPVCYYLFPSNNFLTGFLEMVNHRWLREDEDIAYPKIDFFGIVQYISNLENEPGPEHRKGLWG